MWQWEFRSLGHVLTRLFYHSYRRTLHSPKINPRFKKNHCDIPLRVLIWVALYAIIALQDTDSTTTSIDDDCGCVVERSPYQEWIRCYPTFLWAGIIYLCINVFCLIRVQFSYFYRKPHHIPHSYTISWAVHCPRHSVARLMYAR